MAAPAPQERENKPTGILTNKELELEFDAETAPVLATGANPTLRTTKATELQREFTRPEGPKHVIPEAKNQDRRAAQISEQVGYILRRSLFRFLRGVSKKVIEINDPRKRAILEKLAELDLTDKDAAYLYEIVDKYFREGPGTAAMDILPGEQKSPFETDLLAIKVQAPSVFNVLVDIFQDIGAQIGFNQDQLNKLIKYKQQQTEVARQGEMDPEKKKEIEDFLEKIDEKFTSATIEDRREKSLILNYLLSPDPETLAQWEKMANVTALRQRVVAALTAQGKNIVRDEVEFEKYYQLAQEYRGTGQLEGYIGRYSNEDVQKGYEQFKDEIVFQKLFIQQGKDANGKNIYVWNEEATEYFIRSSRQMINGLFQKIDENPNADFREQFNDLIEGNVMRTIADKFFQLSNSKYIKDQLGDAVDPNTGRKLTDVFYDFMRRKLVFTMYLERAHRELYHNITYIFEALEPEKWPSAFKRIGVSELAVLTEDPVINASLELWKSYLQERLLQNGNLIPADLLGGEIKRRDKWGKLLPGQEQVYSFTDRDAFIERLRNQIREIEKREPDKWELERAFSLAKGMTALTMEMSAVLSNARVTESYESVPLSDIISKHNPRFLWGWGRGGRPELMKSPSIYMIKLKLMQYKGNLKQQLQQAYDDRWIPMEVKNMGDKFEKSIEDLDDNDVEQYHKIVDELTQYLFDHETTWFHLIQKISMGDAITQGDWRIKGVQEVYKEFNKKMAADGSRTNEPMEWGKENWRDIYEFFYNKMGVTFGFAFSADRAKEEGIKMIEVALRRVSPNDPNIHQTIEKLLRSTKQNDEDYARWEKDKREEEIMEDIMMNGARHNKKMSFNEYWEHRLNGIRGETFYHLLQKDPLAFLNNLGQIMPQLQEGKVGDRTAAQLYIDLVTPDSITVGSERDKWNKFTRYFGERFVTSREATQETREMMRTIMDFYTNLYQKLGVYKEGSQKPEEARMKNARDLLFRYLTAAHAKAAKIDEVTENALVGGRDRITPQDIVSDEEYDPTAVYDPDNPDDKKAKSIIRTLMFENTNSLMRRFGEHVTSRGMENYFGDGAANVGYTDGFFQRLAYTWWRKNNISVLPNGDLNHDLLYRAIHVSGEDQFFRTYGAFKDLGEVQSEIMKLYSRLKRAAVKEGVPMFDVLEDILKTHSKIKDLEPYIGQQSMREIQYYVSVIVSRFFQQHWVKRTPIPMGNIGAALVLDFKASSLSKAIYQHRAPEFTTDQLREYARWLRKEGMINSDGMWSEQMLLKELGASNIRFFLGELGPNIAAYFILFILFEFIKEAIEEEIDIGGGQQQKKH